MAFVAGGFSLCVWDCKKQEPGMAVQVFSHFHVSTCVTFAFAIVRMLKTVPQWRTAGACVTLVFGVIRGWPFARQDWM